MSGLRSRVFLFPGWSQVVFPCTAYSSAEALGFIQNQDQPRSIKTIVVPLLKDTL